VFDCVTCSFDFVPLDSVRLVEIGEGSFALTTAPMIETKTDCSPKSAIEHILYHSHQKFSEIGVTVQLILNGW
jgi:hypothetical protein